MCSRDDDPSQHDLPRIDWQDNIDAALTDVRAMGEALVFARVEIARLKKIEAAARPLARRTYVDDVVAHVPYDDIYALRLALFGSDEAIPAGLDELEKDR